LSSKLAKNYKFIAVFGGIWFLILVFNITFNNISVISWRSVLLVEETNGIAVLLLEKLSQFDQESFSFFFFLFIEKQVLVVCSVNV
jgi:hypothetical protein